MATLTSDADLIPYIHLKLAALGVPIASTDPETSLARTAGPLLRSFVQPLLPRRSTKTAGWANNSRPPIAGFNPFWMPTSLNIPPLACRLARSFWIDPVYRVCCRSRLALSNTPRLT